MKKIIIALFCCVALIGCNNNQQRNCYAEYKLLSNPDSCSIIWFHFVSDLCSIDNSLNYNPVNVGTTCTSESFLLPKGTIIYSGCSSNASTTNTYTNIHQCEIKIFVNGNLEETRISTGNQLFDFIIP